MYILKSIYIKIYLISIIPAAIMFLSDNSNELPALFLLLSGFVSTFIIWKKDESWRIREFIDRFF